MCVKQDKAASFCSLCERHSHGECVGFSAPCPYILSYFLKGEFEWQDKVKEKKNGSKCRYQPKVLGNSQDLNIFTVNFHVPDVPCTLDWLMACFHCIQELPQVILGWHNMALNTAQPHPNTHTRTHTHTRACTHRCAGLTLQPAYNKLLCDTHRQQKTECVWAVIFSDGREERQVDEHTDRSGGCVVQWKDRQSSRQVYGSHAVELHDYSWNSQARYWAHSCLYLCFDIHRYPSFPGQILMYTEYIFSSNDKMNSSDSQKLPLEKPTSFVSYRKPSRQWQVEWDGCCHGYRQSGVRRKHRCRRDGTSADF